MPTQPTPEDSQQAMIPEAENADGNIVENTGSGSNHGMTLRKRSNSQESLPGGTAAGAAKTKSKKAGSKATTAPVENPSDDDSDSEPSTGKEKGKEKETSSALEKIVGSQIEALVAKYLSASLAKLKLTPAEKDDSSVIEVPNPPLEEFYSASPDFGDISVLGNGSKSKPGLFTSTPKPKARFADDYAEVLSPCARCKDEKHETAACPFSNLARMLSIVKLPKPAQTLPKLNSKVDYDYWKETLLNVMSPYSRVLVGHVAPPTGRNYDDNLAWISITSHLKNAVTSTLGQTALKIFTTYEDDLFGGWKLLEQTYDQPLQFKLQMYYDHINQLKVSDDNAADVVLHLKYMHKYITKNDRRPAESNAITWIFKAFKGEDEFKHQFERINEERQERDMTFEQVADKLLGAIQLKRLQSDEDTPSAYSFNVSSYNGGNKKSGGGGGGTKSVNNNNNKKSNGGGNKPANKGNGSTKTANKDDDLCYRCNKPGHFKRDCTQTHDVDGKALTGTPPGLAKNKNVNTNAKAYFLTVASYQAMPARENKWIADSGSSVHVTHDKTAFTTFEESNEVVTGIGGTVTIKGRGTVTLKSKVGNQVNMLVLDDVWYIPSAKVNLLSHGKVGRKGYSVTTDSKNVRVSKDRKIWVQGKLNSQDLYELDVTVETVAQPVFVNETAKVSEASVQLKLPDLESRSNSSKMDKAKMDMARMWHIKLGHMKAAKLAKLSKITGIEIDEYSEICETCKVANLPKQHFEAGDEPENEILDLIHADILEVSKIPTCDNGKYVLVLTDDHSRKIWVYVLQNKAQAFDRFCDFQSLVENRVGRRIKCIRMDNDSVLCQLKAERYFTDRGIAVEVTVPGNPDQNGVAERNNRTILEMVRVMMLERQVPHELWGPAVIQAARIKNIMPHATTGKIPNEVFYDRKVTVKDLKSFKVFGCVAFAKRSSVGGKLEPQGKKLMHIGKAIEHDAYWLYDPETKQTIVQRHVLFSEDSHYKLLPHTVDQFGLVSLAPRPETMLSPQEWALRVPARLPGIGPPGKLPKAFSHNRDTRASKKPEPMPNQIARLTVPPIKIISDPAKIFQEEGAEEEPSEAPKSGTNSNTPSQPLPTQEPGRETDQTSEKATPPAGVALPELLDVASADENSGAINDKISEASTDGASPLDLGSASRADADEAEGNRVSHDGLQPSVQENATQVGEGRPRRSTKVTSYKEARTYGTKPKSVKKNKTNNVLIMAIMVRELMDEPGTYREAVASPNAAKWTEAMEVEMNSILENDTWELVDLPPGRRAIGCKWVFKIKLNDLNEIARYKARLVAKGFSQVPGIDYDDTYAPVVRFTSIRLLVALAAENGWFMHQMDVTTAFLNGDLDKEIYMVQPEGYAAPGTEGKVLKLKKALYGLKQAPRQWNKKITERLQQLGFKRGTGDQSLYSLRRYVKETKREEVVHLALYVDDLLIVGSSMVLINVIKTELSASFKMTDLGEAKHLLGISIKRDWEKGTITLSQEQYIDKVLDKFNMADCDPRPTPLPSNHEILKGDTIDESMKDVPYASAIGSLMYAMVGTRPDIAAAVGILSRFTHNPQRTHWNMVKRVLGYLKGTKSYGLTYRKTGSQKFVGYSDADWAGDKNGRKSTYGYVFKVGGGAIAWKSQLQKSVALSTTEAEYVGLSEAMKELMWLKKVYLDLGIHYKVPLLYGDNTGSLNYADNQDEHGRLKHIDIRYHFIRDVIQSGLARLEYMPTDLMVADTLTKQLTKEKFDEHREAMGVMDFGTREGVEK